jgi:hypothetical protein
MVAVAQLDWMVVHLATRLLQAQCQFLCQCLLDKKTFSLSAWIGSLTILATNPASSQLPQGVVANRWKLVAQIVQRATLMLKQTLMMDHA